MNQNFMKEKPVMPLVISMALPMTFSMLVNALYNIIDSYFVARISEDAMTALSLVFPLQNLSMQLLSDLQSESMRQSHIFLEHKSRTRRIKQRRWEHFLI